VENVVDIYELSPMQQGILFHALYEPGSEVYFEQMSCEIRSALDALALRRAWQGLIERHPVLRTAFNWEALDKPVQLVYRDVELPWQELDWSQYDPAEQERRLAAYLQADRAFGFELDQPPLMRCALIRLGASAYRFVWSHHHLILDGWCLPILFREALELYHASRRTRPAVLASHRPYRDYIIWLQQQDMAAAERYWREYLRDFRHSMPFNVDRSATAATGYAETATQLPEQASQDVEALARRQRVTLSTVVRAAWALLLHRYSGEADVVFGATVSGRPAALAGVEAMVGLFINTLPVRARIHEHQDLAALLAKMGEQQVAAEEFAFAPLASIQKWSETPAGAPLFESLLVFENYPLDASLEEQVGDLQIGTVQSAEKTNYPLTLVAVPGPCLRLKLLYDRARFDDGVITDMLAHLGNLLSGMAADDAQKLARLEMTDATTRRRLLVDWNATRREYPTDTCLHQLIEAQVERTPDALAVRVPANLPNSTAKSLTYRALNSRANRLAQHLRNLGVGPETPVGVCMERSTEMIVGLLAILKSGGAYLPLDPSYPVERLTFMLQDAGVNVVLAQQHLLSALPASSARVICIDADPATFAHLPATNPAAGARAGNSAYIIYTSGSTGKPKGVANGHRAIVNRLWWMQDAYRLDATDRVLQKTPISFDVSVWELFWPLLTGAVLTLAKPEGHRDPAYLTQLIATEAITTLHFVPSMFRAFLEAPGVECVSRLKRIFCSGEALSSELAGRFLALRKRFDSPCELHNLYGPTEAAVDVTYQACRQVGTAATVPIGRPIANTRIHILDERLQPTPPGVPGQLYIGGVALALGYRNRPELTAEKFIPDPFAGEAEIVGEPGGRLYATGDLARHLPGDADGTIEFLGRLDHQVKIMGFRIEPGEIEAALVRLAGVKQAVILPREAHGRQLLAAYLVLDEIRARFIEEHELYRLPNGRDVVHLNKNETDALYQEIFSTQSYLREGVTLRDGDCIFDVGANIGLFSLFAHWHCRNLQFYGFEPAPPVFEKLESNALLHGLDAHLFDCGLSDHDGEARIVYYPRSTIMSGFYADAAEDAQTTRTYLSHQDAGLRRYADELLADRFDGQTFTCRLRTLSEIIRECGVQRIDLLKIDVEKSELDVLNGINAEDWPKIKQIVVEVHDRDGRLALVRNLLERHGFNVAVSQDRWLEQTELCTLYAVHPARHDGSEDESVATATPAKTVYTATTLREMLAEKLPDHMIPAAFRALAELPLLPNGKLNRAALPGLEQARQEYQAPRTPAEKTLAAIWSELLGQERIGVHDSFFELGGDSILSIQVVARAAQAGLRLTPRQLFRHPVLADLAAVAAAGESETVGTEAVTGALPLLPMQGWFFEQNLHNPEHFNQSVLLEIPASIDPEKLRQALQCLIEQHDALRLRFTRDKDGWRQEIVAPGADDPLQVEDLASQVSVAEAIETIGGAVQASLDLAAGPLFKAVLFRCGADLPGRLLLVAHHLAVDGVSWRILLEDLTTAYGQLDSGHAVRLPARTTSLREWARCLVEYADSEIVTAERAFWLAEDRRTATPLPLDDPAGVDHNTVAAEAQVTVALDADNSHALLHEVAGAYNTQINDVLLTALADAFCRWTGQTALWVMLEDHGREELFDGVDLTRTVGWFTAQYPVLLPMADPDRPGEALKAVKECLRAIPKRGIGYGLLRYLSADAETAAQLRALPQPEVRFNYLGRIDRLLAGAELFKLTTEAHGPGQNPGERRAFLLDINAMVMDGELQVQWSYSRHVYREETVRRLAEDFVQALRRVIAHCLSPEAGGYTPSDFPEAGLNQAELDDFLSEIE